MRSCPMMLKCAARWFMWISLSHLRWCDGCALWCLVVPQMPRGGALSPQSPSDNTGSFCRITSQVWDRAIHPSLLNWGPVSGSPFGHLTILDVKVTWISWQSKLSRYESKFCSRSCRNVVDKKYPKLTLLHYGQVEFAYLPEALVSAPLLKHSLVNKTNKTVKQC